MALLTATILVGVSMMKEIHFVVQSKELKSSEQCDTALRVGRALVLAPYSVRQVATQRTRLQHNMQHNTQHGACNVQHAVRYVQHYSMQTCMVRTPWCTLRVARRIS
jgi:hypothetical protein